LLTGSEFVANEVTVLLKEDFFVKDASFLVCF